MIALPRISETARFLFDSTVSRTGARANLLGLVLTGLAVGFSGKAIAQSGEATVPAEHGKLIRAPQSLGVLGPDLFGDKVNIYNGALEFSQNDLSISGNSSLPVSVGRRTTVGGPGNQGKGLFMNWDLEIPRISGVFSELYGWKSLDAAGQPSLLRCSNFGAPPPVFKPNTSFKYRPIEYWHGNMLYVPGVGEQEILKRNQNASVQWPADGSATSLVTRNFWIIRCLDTLASTDSTTLPNDAGQGFLVISPDGTQYRFDWLASRDVDGLFKVVGRDTRFSLRRREVAVFPTLVTDRFGNTVRYTYDRADKWKLLEIRGSDGAGNPDRVITFQYLPNTHQISSATDGTRTWQYAYTADANGWGALSTVTLPDQSSWQLGGMSARNGDPGLVFLPMEYAEPSPEEIPDMSCDAFPPEVRNGAASGTMVHPSGAIGTFNVFPVRHARNGIPRLCYGDHDFSAPRAYYPQYFDVYSLTSKKIEGPGLPSMTWTTTYDTFNPGWIDCTACSEALSIVSVTDPEGAVTRYSFGSTFNVNEGLLQRVDIGWNGSTALRSTTTRYNQSFTQPVGYSDQDRGDSKLSARIVPQDLRTILQEDTTFTWQVPGNDDFDTRGRPLRTVMSNSLGATRTTSIEYADHLSKWILNRVAKVTEASTGKIEFANQYNAASGNLESVAKFGKTIQRVSYHPDGTLASKDDGLNPATSFTQYKRGVPRNVTHPDGTAETGVVNDIGAVTSRTDQNGYITTYGYDAMGRLISVNYPDEPGLAWNATNVTYTQVPWSEYGLPAGHWREDLKTGNGQTSTFYDAFLRPVLISKVDLANSAATSEFELHRYDFNGRTTFKSFTQRNYSATPPGTATDYDALGRPTTIRIDSELGELTQRYDYLSGFRKQYTDARGNITMTSFQVFDSPSEDAIAAIAGPGTTDIRFDRDIFGKPRSITRSGDGATATRSYAYDTNERLCKTIEPETGATIQQLDGANNVAWRAAGLALTGAACDWESVSAADKIVFTYDALNRLKSTTYGDGSPAVNRTYWPDGLPRTVVSGTSTWTLDYNRRRQPTLQSLSYGGQTYGFETLYNANGHAAQFNYPSVGNPIALKNFVYEPDALGRATRVGNLATGISYHPGGAVAGFTYGNGKPHSMTQNLRGLPEVASDAGVLRDRYSYDENANVRAITDEIPGGVNSRALDYDEQNRLKTANAPSLWGNASYTYDALNNLRTSTVGSRISSYGYDARNLLGSLNSTNASFSFGFGYDARGNVTRRGAQTYEFDLGNRLKQAKDKETYVYDGFGRRLQTTAVDGTVTVTVYSPSGQLLYGRTTAGSGSSSSTQYVYLNRHQIAEVKR